jgi:hypothetical protein
MLYHLTNLQPSFSYFSDRIVHFFAQAALGLWSSCLCLLYGLDHRHPPTHPTCLLRWGSCELLCLGLPQTMILLSSWDCKCELCCLALAPSLELSLGARCDGHHGAIMASYPPAAVSYPFLSNL